MEHIAVYPGSFDPVTNGHLDIIRRGAKLYDKFIVVAMNNSKKQYTFSVEERIDMLKKATADIPNVTVDYYSGLLADYTEQKNAHVIVKGLRAMSDFEYEFQMALANKKMNPNVETMFLTTSAPSGIDARRDVHHDVHEPAGLHLRLGRRDAVLQGHQPPALQRAGARRSGRMGRVRPHDGELPRRADRRGIRYHRLPREPDGGHHRNLLHHKERKAMSITSRPYRLLQDHMAVYDFMTEIYERDWRNGVAAPFLEYALSSDWMDKSLVHRNRLWFDGERIVAFVFYENPVTDVYCSFRPGYEHLADEMVAYALTGMPQSDGRNRLILFGGQTALIAAAQRAGLRRTWSDWDQQYDFSKPLDYPLP
ncbi:MAG: pantetheine-phosphate adenylyltransferase, partial [Clostridia bacterium]|nr:pantetheine-phosphate adenylyltransferase [Clostridia bacterium]